ncbi:hypothetical protein HYH02_000414 [Chlamydomonas schloesseri]|uniref:Uncharacterized protein n=1 Tax=Chlamydomonas schloesseri TaxID=2026947 RepID=A0A836BDA6_9CHLO|nr:hypothetical protein HYH02_000414 [Chlamydomonas schloesseri]|eukprot:KAG2454569.1 hypothetical protein HYH02_000414 [Chlamydomonas schloesseri]
MPSHSEPLPIIRTHGSFVGAPEEPGNGEAGMLEPAAAAAPDCGTRTAFMSAILHSSRLMMDDAHRALEQPMSTSFPDASQRPPSYCSSRSSSGDGGTSSAGLGADGTGAAAGEASAADASSSTAPPSSVHRYGSLMMNSAGWRLAYGIDLHDALLLDRLTPRRTSARQPQQQPQQRTSRASTPELSGASFAAALRAAISAASAARAGSVAVPVLPAALEALGPLGGVQAAPVQQPASPAVTTTQAGYALGTPPRLSPC